MTSVRLVIAVAMTLGAASPGLARNCYDGFAGNGCPWAEALDETGLRKQSCQNLAHIRNQIYNERGYCFAKPEYADLYDNGDCKFKDQDDVPLNAHERKTIERILKIEAAKGC